MVQHRSHLTLISSVHLPRPDLSREELSCYQAELLGAWEAQQVILNYSPGTIALNLQTVDDFLAAVGKFIWEVTSEDLDRFYLDLIGRGLTYSTRRRYGAALGAFLDYLRARRGEEIWQRVGSVVPDIIDRYNRHRHRADDRDRKVPPPAQETVAYFFAWLREELRRCRKWATAARDYAVFQVLYSTGLRLTEAVMLDVHDVYFDLGPMGKLQVRHGKATRGSGPRRR
jgi:integrase